MCTCTLNKIIKNKIFLKTIAGKSINRVDNVGAC